MNWGLRIVLGLGTFMLFIVCSVIYMVSKDSDTLVEEDYYEQGLNYDDIYDRKLNLQNDGAKPIVKLVKDSLRIIFKADSVNGYLNFKRPSNSKLDIAIPFSIETNVFQISTSDFAVGNWSLEVIWDSHGRKYVHNQSIFIQQ